MPSKLVVGSAVDAIKKKLQLNGSLCSLEQYIESALFDPNNGFYIQARPLEHDFATPSLLSGAFNESIALWVSEQHLPHTVEYGGGTAATALSILNKIPTQPYYFIEKSSHYRAEQQKIKNFDVRCQDKLTEPLSAVVILQEVFDCLPARWFKINDNIKEILLCTEQYIPTYNILEIDQAPKRLLDLMQNYSSFQYMYSKAAIDLLINLYNHLDRGVVFILDYGNRSQGLIHSSNLVSSPVRAYQKHLQLKDFWNIPGSCDLTYDVDFDLLMQTWLMCDGSVRYYGTLTHFLLNETDFIKKNCPHAKMLLDSRFLGEAFKVLILEKNYVTTSNED